MITKYFDIPVEFNKKNVHGSSTVLFQKLIKELEGAKKIYISFFLFNNPFIQRYLEEWGRDGCEINVYSIPLKGYERKEVKLYKKDYCETNTIKSSKYEYAEKIYSRLIAGQKNITLKIFPHTFLWNKQYYSRGKEQYSLHNKSVFAVFEKDSKCILSSCNFAFGDPPHSDNFLVISNKESTIEMYKRYFALLDKNSLLASEYFQWEKNNHDFQYIFSIENIVDTGFTDYFTAPFIKYNDTGSNKYIQDKIIEFIKGAKKEILICAQHFSDVNSFDSNAGSLVKELQKLNEGIEIRILKQTLSQHQKQGKRTLATEKILQKSHNVQQRYWSPIVHDKFIVVDHQVLVSTGNFTPTQFAWRENYEMEYENAGNIYKVKSTFSEINSYSFIYEHGIAEDYRKHFNKLWNSAKSVF